MKKKLTLIVVAALALGGCAALKQDINDVANSAAFQQFMNDLEAQALAFVMVFIQSHAGARRGDEASKALCIETVKNQLKASYPSISNSLAEAQALEAFHKATGK